MSAVAAVASPAVAVRRWFVTRHSLRVEVAIVVGAYMGSDLSRGLASGNESSAVHHANDVVALERSLHVFVERDVQHAIAAVPGFVGTVGFAYLTLHIAATAALLLWLHRRRPDAYPFIRTTLLVASLTALVGYVVFPTAPPRLSGLGIFDSVSTQTHIDLGKGLTTALYNPYAAMPSMHAGYAVVVGAALYRLGRRRIIRLAGLVYPALVVLVIVATGNHFVLDAAAGVLVVALAAVVTALMVRAPRSRQRLVVARPAIATAVGVGSE